MLAKLKDPGSNTIAILETYKPPGRTEQKLPEILPGAFVSLKLRTDHPVKQACGRRRSCDHRDRKNRENRGQSLLLREDHQPS